MSRLIYNGFELPYIQTPHIDEETQYSEDGMDYIYSRIRLTVRSVITTGLSGLNSQERPADIINRVRGVLLNPRKHLQYWTGDTSRGDKPLFDVVGVPNIATAGQYGDVCNGPKPIYCNIMQVGGTEAYLIEYQIELCIPDCADDCSLHPGACGPATLYLTHRFQDTEEYDDNWFATRTRTGYVRVRGDQQLSPEFLRTRLYPPIPPGFKREHMEFKISTDGLTFNYEIKDRQVYYQPPFPASKARGEYKETTPYGVTKMMNCRVRLEGPPTATQSSLVAAAIAVCVLKVSPNGTFGNSALLGSGSKDPPVGVPVLTMASIAQGLYENWVEVEIQAMINPGKVSLANVSIDLLKFNIPPPGTPLTAMDLGAYAATSVGTLAAALRQSLCDGSELGSGGASLTSGGGIPGGLTGTQAPTSSLTTGGPSPTQIGTGGPTTVTIGVVPPGGNNPVLTTGGGNPILKAGQGGLYLTYNITQTFKRFNNVLHLPLGYDAQGGQTVAQSFVAQLGQPHVQKTIQFRASMLGGPPSIPDYHDTDANNVLLEASIGTEEPKNLAGASLLYTVFGTYRFACIDPSKVVVMFGIPPALSAVAMKYTLTKDLLLQNIATPGAAQGDGVTMLP